jgi:hypothetical protein
MHITPDAGRHSQTQTDIKIHRQTQTDTDLNIPAQTDTYKKRQKQTYTYIQLNQAYMDQRILPEESRENNKCT